MDANAAETFYVSRMQLCVPRLYVQNVQSKIQGVLLPYKQRLFFTVVISMKIFSRIFDQF